MTYLSPTNLIDGDVSNLLPRLTQLSLRKICLLLIHYVLDMTDNLFEARNTRWRIRACLNNTIFEKR